jgi:hypothetical protein
MAFTKEEFEAWHRAKLKREFKPTPSLRQPPAAICIHCHQPFGWTEGMISADVAICDICNGD